MDCTTCIHFHHTSFEDNPETENGMKVGIGSQYCSYYNHYFTDGDYVRDCPKHDYGPSMKHEQIVGAIQRITEEMETVNKQMETTHKALVDYMDKERERISNLKAAMAPELKIGEIVPPAPTVTYNIQGDYHETHS